MKYWLVVFLLLVGIKSVWAANDSLWVGAWPENTHFNIELIDQPGVGIGGYEHATRWRVGFDRWIKRSGGRLSASYYTNHSKEHIQAATGYFPLEDTGFAEYDSICEASDASYPADTRFIAPGRSCGSIKVRLNLHGFDAAWKETYRMGVVLHELGHGLGLDENSDSNDIMGSGSARCYGNYDECIPTDTAINQINVWYK